MRAFNGQAEARRRRDGLEAGFAERGLPARPDAEGGEGVQCRIQRLFLRRQSLPQQLGHDRVLPVVGRRAGRRHAGRHRMRQTLGKKARFRRRQRQREIPAPFAARIGRAPHAVIDGYGGIVVAVVGLHRRQRPRIVAPGSEELTQRFGGADQPEHAQAGPVGIRRRPLHAAAAGQGVADDALQRQIPVFVVFGQLLREAVFLAREIILQPQPAPLRRGLLAPVAQDLG